MKTNKIIILILFLALIFSSISMVLLNMEINKYNNREETKPNIYICEKSEKTETTSQIYRDEITYNDNGIVTDYKSGNIIEFKDSTELKNNTKKYDKKYKIIGENKIFLYDNYDVEIKANDGNTYLTWYKYSLNSRIKDGYNCYKEGTNEK